MPCDLSLDERILLSSWHNTALQSCLLLALISRLLELRKMKNLFLYFLGIFLIHSLGLAQSIDLVFFSYTGSSNTKSLQQAKNEIIEQAIQEATQKYIVQIIGSEKFLKEKALIEKKIIKNSSKYVPFVKSEQPIYEGGQTQIDVQLRVSLSNLKSLLLENNLMYDIDGAPKVMPFVEFDDRVRFQSYYWWQAEETGDLVLKRLSEIFSQNLKEVFGKKGFFVSEPEKSRLSHLIVKENRRSDLPLGDLRRIAEPFSTHLLLFGKVQIERKEVNLDFFILSIHLQVAQSKNGRIIADLRRTFETDGGVYETVLVSKWTSVVQGLSEDLLSQITKIWETGVFGSSLVILEVQGSELNFSAQTQLKEALLADGNVIKGVRERFLTSNQIDFELDVSGDQKSLLESIKKIKIGSKSLKIKKAGGDESNRLITVLK